MTGCSYCSSTSHHIGNCKVDNELVAIMDLSTCPKFFDMSIRILKKIASCIGVKTSMSKIQLACRLSQEYRKKHESHPPKECINPSTATAIETEPVFEDDNCPICFDDFVAKGVSRNTTITKCGHKFCTTCIIIHTRKNNTCPCCRTILIERQPLADIGIASPIPEIYNEWSNELENLRQDTDAMPDTLISLIDVLANDLSINYNSITNNDNMTNNDNIMTTINNDNMTNNDNIMTTINNEYSQGVLEYHRHVPVTPDAHTSNPRSPPNAPPRIHRRRRDESNMSLDIDVYMETFRDSVTIRER